MSTPSPENRIIVPNNQGNASDVTQSILLRMPLEIRQEIYRALVVTLSVRPFWQDYNKRSRGPPRLVCRRYSDYIDLDILQTSRQIYVEASEIFYRENHFRFQILPYQHPPRQPSMDHLANMVHVSLRYDESRRVRDRRQIDQQLSRYIRHVLNHCPSIKTFTLHLEQIVRFDGYIWVEALKQSQDFRTTTWALGQLLLKTKRATVVESRYVLDYNGPRMVIFRYELESNLVDHGWCVIDTSIKDPCGHFSTSSD